MKKIKEFIKADNIDIDDVDAEGYTALSIASGLGDIDVVKLLLKNGADVNKKRKVLHFPLLQACMCGHINIVKLLLKNKANINIQDKEGITALMYASINRYADITKLLLKDSSIDDTILNKAGFTALTFLYDKYKKIHDGDSFTEIFTRKEEEMTASEEFKAKKGKEKLKERERIDAEARRESAKIANNMRQDYLEVLKTMLVLTDITKKDKKGRTPLMLACRHNQTLLVKLLVDVGKADINERDENDRTPLICAGMHLSENIIKFLIEKGADINAQDKFGETVLVKLLRRKRIATAKVLLKCPHIDLTPNNIDGTTIIDVLKLKNIDLKNKNLFEKISEMYKEQCFAKLQAQKQNENNSVFSY